MNRRKFILSPLLLFPLLYSQDSSAVFAPFFARVLLRYAFRALTRRAFSRLVVRTVGRSITRTRPSITRLNRIQRTFTNKRYNITGRNGRIVGTAQVEGDILILRNSKKRALGYIQTDGGGLAVYNGSRDKIISFRQKGDRIVAYNKNEDYMGQIIEDMVEDEIVSYFVDREGVKHKSIPIELKNEENILSITNKNVRVSNGRLEILDNDSSVKLYGIQEDNDIILYDINDDFVATIKKHDGVISAYNKEGESIDINNGLISIKY